MRLSNARTVTGWFGVCAIWVAIGLSGAAATAESPASAVISQDVWKIDEQQRLEQWEGYREAKEQGRIIYVARDGSGDFNCNGEDDQVQINAALRYVREHDDYDIVHLKGHEEPYTISGTIEVGSNTILQGDTEAHVRLQAALNWPKWSPMIASKHMEPAGEVGAYTRQNPDSIQNVTIRGFELNGHNWANRGTRVDGERKRMGAGWDLMIVLVNADHTHIHHMFLRHVLNDQVVIRGAGDHGQAAHSRIYNNRFHAHGHDGIYMQNVREFEIFNNYMTQNRTNSMIRTSGACHDYKIYNNVLRGNSSSYSGHAGIQIQNGSHTIDGTQEIYGNDIYGMALGGISIYGYGAEFGTQTGFHIHNNHIYRCRPAAIRIYGAHNTVIENNVFHDNKGAGVLHWFPIGTLGEDHRHLVGAPPAGQKYRTIVRNNIITDTRAIDPDNTNLSSGRLPPESGFALNNLTIRYSGEPGEVSSHLEGLHEFVSGNNCLYGNANGPYNNAGSDTDIHEDPKFVDAENGDFRLQPDSPCIGSGTDGQNIGPH